MLLLASELAHFFLLDKTQPPRAIVFNQFPLSATVLLFYRQTLLVSGYLLWTTWSMEDVNTVSSTSAVWGRSLSLWRCMTTSTSPTAKYCVLFLLPSVVTFTNTIAGEAQVKSMRAGKGFSRREWENLAVWCLDKHKIAVDSSLIVWVPAVVLQNAVLLLE